MFDDIGERWRILSQLELKPRGEYQHAVIAGNVDYAKQLGGSKTGVSKTAVFGTATAVTDLQLASLCGETDLVRDLVRRTTKIDATCRIPFSYGGRATALHFAVAFRHNDIVRVLVAHGARLTAHKVKPKAGSGFAYFPPALLALPCWLKLSRCRGPADVLATLDTLLALGWDLDGPADTVRRSLLHLAVRLPQELVYVRLGVVEFLLARGADVLVRSFAGAVPLHLAVRWNQTPETVRLLLRRRPADQIAATDRYGNTMLHDAAWNRRDNGPKVSLDILSCLLTAGAATRARNVHNETPVDVAKGCGRVKHNDLEVVQLLMAS